MGELYKLTFPSGKAYIGITLSTARERLRHHYYGRSRNYAISNAIKKYGVDAVQIDVLARSDNWDDLCRLECEAIEEHRTRFPGGYNLTGGGEGIPERTEHEHAAMVARIREPAKLLRASETSRERWKDPEYRAKCLEPLQGLWKDPEYRKKRTAALRAMLAERNSDPIRMQELSARMTGAANPQAKLQPEDVREIRRRLATGEAQKAIAADFGVHPSTISLINKGKKWARLDTEMLGLSQPPDSGAELLEDRP
jgi:hypothetical protein